MMNFPRTGGKAWWRALWSAAIVLALALLLRSDLAHLHAVSELSLQGNPPPAQDPDSPTGYVLGQRHFLGKQERGETYRWIAATQQLVSSGLFSSPVYEADTVPTGRPQLMPKLYAAWLAGVTWGVHLTTGEPMGIAAERAALWEPVISHVLAFAAAVAFMAIRCGAAGAAMTALLFAFFPPFFVQFLPGVLTPRIWALLLATYAIAQSLPASGDDGKSRFFNARSAAAASLALWLDPACGFPAVLVSASAGATAIFTQQTRLPCLRWSLIGSGVTLAAWLVDRSPWAPAAGELRYVHPWYAFAWLGIGLAIDGGQHWRGAERFRKWRWAEIAGAVLLLAGFGYTQIKNDYRGWLYPSGWMRRISSLEEPTAFRSAIDWLGQASAAEAALLCAPIAAAVVALALRANPLRKTPFSLSLAPAAVGFAGLLALAFFRVRWGVVAALAALPLASYVATREFAGYRRTAAAVTAAFLVGLVFWNPNWPAAFKRPAGAIELSAPDLEALVYRHFAHWLASHNPGQKVAALAPPELSDSIVFHGAGRVLISTAWESYPGQLAARRILSSLESTEAEAVLQGHELTHVILPSWDKVLPLFVQTPLEPGKETLFARLQRWVFPPYLRPLPYKLPPLTAFDGQQLVVFQVTAPQDEPLLLSRLAEYFVEMERTEPATMVARVLAESYPDDPNAAIGRAIAYAHTQDRTGFERELARLAADVKAGRTPSSWDRRVQRAIVLALGRQRELARNEIEACVATATAPDILTLTPLQAYRLATLARSHRLEFAESHLTGLLAALGAEYLPRAQPRPDH